MPNYLRAWVPGGTYFFTVALLDRRQALLTEHVADLRHAFRSACRRRPFTIDAIVVLPDHLHCLWTLPPEDADYASRWQDIKSRFAAGRARKGERGIWQRRYWEHQIRDDRDFERHADYLHFNPVKHGWVHRVSDWPYSSFHRFVRRGVYQPDWGGTRDAAELEPE